MRNLLLLLFLLCLRSIFGQIEQSKRPVVVGVSLPFFLTNYDYHGFSPSLTLNYKKHQFSLGGRIPVGGDHRFSNGKNNQFVLVVDFQYRYLITDRWKYLKPYAFLSLEYGFERYRRDLFYNQSSQQAYGPIFDHSFDYALHVQSHELNLCLGIGAELPIYKNVYCFFGGGIGQEFAKYQEEWIETSTNQQVYEYAYRSRLWNRIAWTASAGIGYRFFPLQTKAEAKEYRRTKRAEFTSP